jgi:hypothetical protein
MKTVQEVIDALQDLVATYPETAEAGVALMESEKGIGGLVISIFEKPLMYPYSQMQADAGLWPGWNWAGAPLIVLGISGPVLPLHYTGPNG